MKILKHVLGLAGICVALAILYRHGGMNMAFVDTLSVSDVEISAHRVGNPYPMSRYVPGYEAPENRYSVFSGQYLGKEYSYHIYPAKDNTPDKPKPLVILLHGTYRNGAAMVDMWKRIADKKGLAVIAPDSEGISWFLKNDTADMIAQLPQMAAHHFNVDKQQVYIFGHSDGVAMVLYTMMRHPNTFAAAGGHAGFLRSSVIGSQTKTAARRTPVVLLIGTDDELVPLAGVHDAAKGLTKMGYVNAVYEIDRHNHWYYSNANFLNETAWHFMGHYKGIAQ